MAFQRTDATLLWLRTPPAMLAPIRNNGAGASVFAWIRHTVSGGNPRVGWGAAGAAEPRLIANNNNGVLRGIYAQSGSTLITGTTTAGLNTWFPIAVSYRMAGGNGNTRAVGNQILLTSTPAACAATEALVQFTVGQDPGDNIVTDTGEFAHAAAWNIALSDEEMQALNRGANPLRIRPGNLVGYWPLESDGCNLAMPNWPLNPAGSATSAPVWVAGPPGIEPPLAPPVWLYGAPAAGNATANGVTLTATASLIAGAGQAASTAAGATLTATASLVAGAATASSTAVGVTLGVTASFIPGNATAGGSATASGTTLTVTASFIPGSASGASVVQTFLWAGRRDFIATRVPAVTDDIGTGADRGDFWWWGNRLWLCRSSGAGAAVWLEVTLGA